MTSAVDVAPRLVTQVELRQLRYFCVVAQELNFTRAAGRLHITQQGLSTSVRQLEAVLGTTLFIRGARAVELTAAGLLLSEEAPLLLASAAELQHRILSAADDGQAPIRVGYSHTVAFDTVGRLYRALKRTLPDHQLVGRMLPRAHIASELRHGRIDVAVIDEPRELSDLLCASLGREPVLAALGVAHPLAAADEVTLAQLSAAPLAVMDLVEAPSLHHALVDLCASAGIEPASPPVSLARCEAWALAAFCDTDFAYLAPSGVAAAFAQWGLATPRVIDAHATLSVELVADPERVVTAVRRLLGSCDDLLAPPRGDRRTSTVGPDATRPPGLTLPAVRTDAA